MVHAHAHRDHHAALQERSLEERDPKNEAVTIVYVTAAATFDGPIGGYVTGVDPAETTTRPNQGLGVPVGHTRPSTTEEETTTAESKPKTTKQTKPTFTEAEPTTTERTTKATKAITTDNTEDITTPTTFSTATSSSTSSLTIPGLDTTTTTHGSSSLEKSASPSASPVAAGSSSGLTGGAKAGIAIGVILGLGLIAGFIFFFMRKRKQGQQMAEAEAVNEKSYEADNMLPPGPPPKPQPMTPSEPPQLNVRPVTQFAPDLTPMGALAAGGAGAGAGAGAAAGATLGVAAAGSRNLTGNASPPHTPQSSVSRTDPFGDPVNPFGNQAEAPSPVAATGPPSPSAIPLPQSPLSPTVPAPSDSGVESALGAAATGAAVAGGVAAAAAAKPSDKDLPGRPESSSSQASSVPEGSAQSPVSAISADPASIATAAAVAVPAFGPGGAASPPPPGPSNVHRVQLDFKPSMEDELELHAGQLVRLLHEYDDGWALCVRLDRSQQGVVPRSRPWPWPPRAAPTANDGTQRPLGASSSWRSRTHGTTTSWLLSS
ncbi:hypothetical protein CNMCM8980_004862 [Aspergillus fumigatiaffinis]|uniref:SH3 domain-containing protein n=1 Tax=Aspergillus fumigatiaffinis TaxID=340414 RepID=A0A8H4GQT3_9EURO|nr:hypothetical protein CNMCM5878_004849 [Aspergillus fumigatiaffinis]KAF4226491.1 hypothetical protein CNMCM6805_004545 [Aspergillus fumigatiaffinis]KAF4232557.1 hypothetical protein CNMCM8980_004862 [Aspergillus fumigatiaffinis]